MPNSPKQYVDLSGITVYDEEIKNYIAGLDFGTTYTLSLDPANPRKILLTPSEGTGSYVVVPEDAIYLTQAEYNAITPVEHQLYGITDLNPVAAEVIDDTTTSLTTTWSSDKIDTIVGDIESLLSAL